MKIPFLTLKRKSIIAVLLCILAISIFCASYFPIKASTSPKPLHTIVIDAGHGGRDGGSVGVNGTIEKEINLTYAMTLRDKLKNAGFDVVMTRENDDGLYNPLATNKKMSDMKARMKIIKKANPALVISIHMNSFTNHGVSGANTYYRKGDEASKTVADLVQQSLSNYCNAKEGKSKVGDYYILNESYYTSILVECGFISNENEERKLNTSAYRETLCDAIFNGVKLYFG